MMEFMLHTVRNRLRVDDWSEPEREAEGSSLTLRLRPAGRAFRDAIGHGFSYQWAYESEDLPIYRVLDRGTWEPDGDLIGKEFWLRNGVMPSCVRFESAADRYSTEWHLPSIQQPNIFQFFPLQAQLQGFTTTFGADGALMTWPTEVAHVRSLFEKHAGKNVMFHWHEHCGDLACAFATSPVEVLWLEADCREVRDKFNVWESVRETVWSALHEQVGMAQERVTSYGVVEEWERPDFDRYTREAVPALRDAGIRTIMIPNEFENNMNVWGVGNMCCTVDLKVAEAVGVDRLRGFCNAAHEAGAEVEMWGNTSLSTLTPMFWNRNGSSDRIEFLPREGSAMDALSAARDPWVRNASGAIEADHYTPVFAVMNLREPAVRKFWLDRWEALRREVGVDGIFVDSSFNLSADKFCWRQNDRFDQAGGATIDQSALLGNLRPDPEPPAAIASQYRAYLDLMVEMQRNGYRICGEDVGVFGTSRSGPDLAMRLPCLPMWVDSYCAFSEDDCRAADLEPEDVFFQGLAYRVSWFVYWHIPSGTLSFRYEGGDPAPTPWHRERLRAFGRLASQMGLRTIRPDGVEYRSASSMQYWAFRDATVDLGSVRSITDELDGSSWRSSLLEAKRNRVYVVTA